MYNICQFHYHSPSVNGTFIDSKWWPCPVKHANKMSSTSNWIKMLNLTVVYLQEWQLLIDFVDTVFYFHNDQWLDCVNFTKESLWLNTHHCQQSCAGRFHNQTKTVWLHNHDRSNGKVASVDALLELFYNHTCYENKLNPKTYIPFHLDFCFVESESTLSTM